jgi:hypothetical protein
MENELWEGLKNNPMMIREFVDIHNNMSVFQKLQHNIALFVFKFKKTILPNR